MMLKLAFYLDLTDNNEIKAQKIWEKFLDKKSLQFSHSVSKSQKKSHSKLRAKRATFTKWTKVILRVFENLILLSNNVTRQFY